MRTGATARALLVALAELDAWARTADVVDFLGADAMTRAHRDVVADALRGLALAESAGGRGRAASSTPSAAAASRWWPGCGRGWRCATVGSPTPWPRPRPPPTAPRGIRCSATSPWSAPGCCADRPRRRHPRAAREAGRRRLPPRGRGPGPRPRRPGRARRRRGAGPAQHVSGRLTGASPFARRRARWVPSRPIAASPCCSSSLPARPRRARRRRRRRRPARRRAADAVADRSARGAPRRPPPAHLRRRERRGLLVVRRHAADLPGDPRRRTAATRSSRMRRRRRASRRLVSTGKGRTTCSYFTARRRAHPLRLDPRRRAPTARRRPTAARATSGPLYAELRHLHRQRRRHATSKRLTDIAAATTPRPPSVRRTARSSSPRTRDGDLELYRMNADGSDVVRLTNTPGYDGGAFFIADCTQDRLARLAARRARRSAEYQRAARRGPDPRRPSSSSASPTPTAPTPARSPTSAPRRFAPVLLPRRQAHHLLVQLRRPQGPRVRPLGGRHRRHRPRAHHLHRRLRRLPDVLARRQAGWRSRRNRQPARRTPARPTSSSPTGSTARRGQGGGRTAAERFARDVRLARRRRPREGREPGSEGRARRRRLRSRHACGRLGVEPAASAAASASRSR